MALAAVQQQHFRRACSKFATGITILTVLDESGNPHGLTVNSFTSVSLTPPLVLVCIDIRTRLLDLFREGCHFGVSVLNEDQQELSARFARSGEGRFDGVPWDRGESGVPLLPGSIAAMECAVTRIVEAGDHAILLGEVQQASWSEGQPLIYFNSGYQRLKDQLK